MELLVTHVRVVILVRFYMDVKINRIMEVKGFVRIVQVESTKTGMGSMSVHHAQLALQRNTKRGHVTNLAKIDFVLTALVLAVP